MDTSFDDLYSGMESALGGQPEAAPETPATAPVGEEPTAETPAPEQQTEQPAPEGEAQPAEGQHNQEGVGDHTKAFQAYRAEIAVYKAQLAEAQAAQQEAAQYRAYFAQLQAQQQEAQFAQQLEQYSDDPESLAALLQTRQAEFQQQAQAQQRETVLRMGADLARATLPDFDNQVGKLYQAFGAEVVDHLASQQANGPLWAYQMAQMLRTPEEFQAAVQSEAQRLFAETQARTQPKTPIASRGIGQIPAAAPNANPHPASESFRALNFGPGTQSFEAAYENLLRASGG